MFSFTINCFLTCLLCIIIPSSIKAQGGCYLQGINLEACRDQDLNSISESCCRALNQAFEIGFRCLCLLLPISSAIPILNFPSYLPFPNCYISVPSLAQCQAPTPGLFTPAIPVPLQPSPVIPKEMRQPTFSPTLPSSNSTSANSAAIRPQYPISKDAQSVSLSRTRNVTSNCDNKVKNKLHQNVRLLIITLIVCTL